MGGALPSGCNNYPWKNIYIFYTLIFTWMMEPKYVTRGWRLYGMQILFVYFLYYTFCSTNYMYLTFFFILNFNYFIRKVKKYVTRKKNICIHLYVFQTVSIKSTFFFQGILLFLIWIKRQKQKISLSNGRAVNGEPTHESPTKAILLHFIFT